MNDERSLRAEVARKIREMGPLDTALWTLIFLVFVVMPTLGAAGYLLAYLAYLNSGCGA